MKNITKILIIFITFISIQTALKAESLIGTVDGMVCIACQTQV